MKKKLIFKEETHTYWLDHGGMMSPLISVTQLLKKHKISKSYDDIDPVILQAKAAYGTLIHKYLENFIKNKEKPILDCKEVDSFEKWLELSNCELPRSETRFHNNLIAGTVDFIYLDRGGKVVIADFKTSANLDYTGVRWQLSLYAYLWASQKENPVEAYDLIDIQAFHFLQDGELKIVNFQKIEYKEVEVLLDCEKNGEIYVTKSLEIADDLLELSAKAEQELITLENAKKAAETRARAYRSELYELMLTQGIKTAESKDGKMLITRIDPLVTVTVDSKKLKSEEPEIFDKYSKKSERAGYIKITIRN